MNGCLAFDIQHLICQEYDLSGRDLCQLALTSRSWRDAALPRIWAELDAITPLLKLLPEDKWDMKRQLPDVPKLYFALRHPLERADWDAVYDRSRFVKELSVHDTQEEDLHDLSALFSLCSPPAPLFPRLDRLRVELTERRSVLDLWPLLDLLLSPSLTSVHIRDPRSKLAGELDLPSLANQCPHIEDLAICTTRKSHPAYHSDLSAAIEKWDKLDTIVLSLCSPDLLLPLSLHPHLRRLGLIVSTQEAPTDGRCRLPVLPPDCFPSLTFIVWSGLTLFEFATFASLGHVRAMEVICVNHPGEAPLSTELQLAMDAIAAYCDPDALAKIILNHDTEVNASADYALTMEHILPLADFASLQHVSLGVTTGALLSDEDYAELLPCWPHLEHFEVETGADAPAGWVSPATLLALKHFAHFCPKLKELCLPLTAHEVPEYDDIDVVGDDHPLCKLDIGPSSISAPLQEVAEFLRCAFPNLGKIIWTHRRIGDAVQLHPRLRELVMLML
ncbi:uncharacterized protein SCHCODRAFT_02567731 [Schizophyllum commune H4-8]|nr:uncharacterized protein SCHCODRAFT_02567731 [Schizophyllum commune H4-8]KAI5898822.1 hypothetical protein SCHCODRAFT_02567731 [Schizophyllum commune H4-8]